MLLAVAAVLALFGTRVLLHPGSAAVGSNPANDFQIMTWSLVWWPWAFGHGVNPLHTPLLWPPDGFPSPTTPGGSANAMIPALTSAVLSAVGRTPGHGRPKSVLKLFAAIPNSHVLTLEPPR